MQTWLLLLLKKKPEYTNLTSDIKDLAEAYYKFCCSFEVALKCSKPLSNFDDPNAALTSLNTPSYRKLILAQN